MTLAQHVFKNMKTVLIVFLGLLIPQCCDPSLHIMHTHTHTRTRLVVCLGFVTYLHHYCVTRAPPLLCCFNVSIHQRPLYLKLRPPPHHSSPWYPPSSPLRCLVVTSLLFLCSPVTGLIFFFLKFCFITIIIIIIVIIFWGCCRCCCRRRRCWLVDLLTCRLVIFADLPSWSSALSPLAHGNLKREKDFFDICF